MGIDTVMRMSVWMCLEEGIKGPLSVEYLDECSVL